MKKGHNFYGIRSLVVGLFILVMFSSSECEGPEGRIATGSYKTQYQRGHDDGFNAALAHCDSLSQEELKAEYEEGHQDGYIEGKEDGYEIGYKDGYRKGLIDGYNRGKRDGLRIGEKIGFTKGEIFGYGKRTKHILIGLGANFLLILIVSLLILFRKGGPGRYLSNQLSIPVEVEKNAKIVRRAESLVDINLKMNLHIQKINRYHLPEDEKTDLIQQLIRYYEWHIAQDYPEANSRKKS